jgi:ribosome-associated translation inhibitor RaiA
VKKSYIFFVGEKKFVLLIELAILPLFYTFNVIKKNKLKIIPYKYWLNNYTIIGFISSTIIIILFHLSSIVFLQFFHSFLQNNPALFDKYILEIVYSVYPFRFLFYFLLKFMYYTSEILFLYLINRNNLKPILVRIFVKLIPQKSFKGNRNFYFEYFISKLPKMTNEQIKEKIGKMANYLENDIELSVLYAIAKNYSFDIDLKEELEEIKNKIQSYELKDMLSLFEEINERTFRSLKKPKDEIDIEFNEQKRELLLAAVFYNLKKYINEYSYVYYLLDLLFEYQYYLELPEIDHNVYPYHFIYIFKEKIYDVLENLKKNEKLKTSYPEIKLLNRAATNLFGKYIERGMI